MLFFLFFFFLQAEDGIRYLVRSRGLGDVYKRQVTGRAGVAAGVGLTHGVRARGHVREQVGAVAGRGLSLIHI